MKMIGPRDAVFLLLIGIMAFYLMILGVFPNSAPGGIDWALAFSTLLLAMATYFAIIENRKAMDKNIQETRTDRRIRLIRSQIEYLYQPLLLEHDHLTQGKQSADSWSASRWPQILNYIYLGSEELHKAYNSYAIRQIEFNEATKQDDAAKNAEEKKAALDRLEAARTAMYANGSHLFEIAEIDYRELNSELRELSQP